MLSVRHQLPEPNSLLPADLRRSEPAYHLRKKINDITATSSRDWPLADFSNDSSQAPE